MELDTMRVMGGMIIVMLFTGCQIETSSHTLVYIHNIAISFFFFLFSSTIMSIFIIFHVSVFSVNY